MSQSPPSSLTNPHQFRPISIERLLWMVHNLERRCAQVGIPVEGTSMGDILNHSESSFVFSSLLERVLIFFVAALNRQIDENGPSGLSSPTAIPNPHSLTPEMTESIDSVDRGTARRVRDIATLTASLRSLMRRKQRDLACRIYLMERIVVLTVLLSN
jgi:hypothetical protein